MSLVAFAIRIAAERAIRAAVWPGFAIVESPQAPLDLVERSGQPLIAIFTGHNTDKIEGRELLGGSPRVSLDIQVYLPPKVWIATSRGGGSPLEFDTSDCGADTVLDVIGRRIDVAFLGQAEPWSQILFEFVTDIPKTTENSYLVQTQKVRVAARETTLVCDVLHEPSPGAPPSDVWARFVDLMRTDDAPRSVAPLADWIAAEIAGPASLSQAERDRIYLGLSEYAAQAVRITPAPPEDANDTADDPDATVDEVPADPAALAPDGYPVTP